MSRRDYSFIADTDSLDALRRLRRGWAGWELAEGEFRVRLREGGTVRAHVDRAQIETEFEVSCLVAEYAPDAGDAPGSRLALHLARERRHGLPRRHLARARARTSGADHSIQYSGIPGYAIPETAVAKCDFTDAFSVTTEGAGLVVRLALRPGWLEIVEDPEQVAEFLTLRGVT